LSEFDLLVEVHLVLFDETRSEHADWIERDAREGASGAVVDEFDEHTAHDAGRRGSVVHGDSLG
jgi:hypothetical protein